MRITNCRSVRREIDEVATGELLSSSANDHLKTCAECGTFHEERLKLREMLASLGSVEAPGDFDFRLRARLANEKGGERQPFVMRNSSFGLRSIAVTAMLLLVGSAILFANLRTSPDSSLSENDTKPSASAVGQSPKAGQTESSNGSTVATNVDAKVYPSGSVDEKKTPVEKVTSRRPRSTGQAQSALAGNNGPNGRVKTRDESSTAARVFRPEALDATQPSAFPIGTSYQSLKVSLDDGRGTSRTISLPSVSFGSQRVLAQGPSPLLASARSDW